MRAEEVRAICWDVGGVFSGTPHAAIASLASEHDIAASALSDAVFGRFDLDTDHPWHRLERGELELRDGWPLIEAEVAALGSELTLRDIFRRIGSSGGDRTEVVALVREAHDAGICNAVITNNVREFADMGDGRGWHRWVPLELMRVVTDSSVIGIRKPDPAIYIHTLSELGVDPHEAAFVDDTAVNVEAAAALGMHGVLIEHELAPALERIRAIAGLS
ncbi:MAG: HAD family phosphatase [Acidimicrobiales bacterium]|nr:HAD family phosphatase [Acidimicrobiales bacterium]MDG1876481.1 HAD family phosphatase [Acidimicrobiales bacterium]